MAFTKLTNELNTVEQLPDTPNRTSGYTAAQMKAFFDENAQLIKTFINDTLIAELESNGALSGNSGAKNVGVASREEFSEYTNVEDVLVYFRELIRQAVAGQIGDNDVKTAMLNHTTGYEAVDTGAIQDNAVTNAKLAGKITSDKITSVLASAIVGAISMSNIDDQSISYKKLEGGIRSSQLYGEIAADKLAGGITNAQLAGGITGDKLVDKTVPTKKIADGAVTTDKIADSNVTTAKIADSNVTTAKIADGNVTTSKIADSNVTSAKIADGNITTAKVADKAITNEKLAGSIDVGKLTGTLPVANGGTGRTSLGTVKLDVTFKDGTTGSYTLITE